jgi:hypothetical protein
MSLHQSWARAFFMLCACAFALLGGALRAGAFALFFLALNFALLRSRFRSPALLDFLRSFFALLDFLRFFLRSSIFRARTFSFLDFCARNFVLVQNRQAEQERQNRMERQNRAGKKRQAKQDRQNRTSKTG